MDRSGIPLAKDLEVFCRGTTGHVYISWNVLNQSIVDYDIDRRFSILSDSFRYENKMIKLVEYLSTYKSFEPRDRIYALLGLMKEDRIQFDYTRTVHLLFVDTIKFLYEDQLLMGRKVPCTPTLCVLAKNMGPDIEGMGIWCFMSLLSSVFDGAAVKEADDIGVDITVSKPLGNETMKAW